MDSQVPSTLQSRSVSPTLTACDMPAKKTLSKARKYLLLFLFAVAQFIDICNISSLFSAVPTIAIALSMSPSQSVWLISGYQLTFASFLLLGGRMSDVYSPKYLFIGGFGSVGIFSLVAGFINDKIGLIVLRAVVGLSAALSIPSALSLIVHLFPEPAEQGHAIAMFAGGGPIGNILGLIIGALFVQYVTWHWVFFFTAIVAIPVAGACFVLIPSNVADSFQIEKELGSTPVALKPSEKLRRLDIVGVSVLTIAVILFIFAVTSGPTSGWASPKFLAPLIISIVMVIGFFFYEHHSPEWRAALPSRVWFYPNFAVWFALSLYPYAWFTAVFLQLTSFWQDSLKWDPIITAVHFLPFGVTAFVIIFLLWNPIQKRLSDRMLVSLEGILLFIGTILLVFADRSSRYWSFVFPAFIIGSSGKALLYAHVNISVFKTAPASQSGVVGAILNSALQLGSAVGTAAITAIQTNVDNKQPDPTSSYQGRAAGLWFLLGLIIVEMIAFWIFFKDTPDPADENLDSSSPVQSDSELSVQEYAKSEEKEAVTVAV